MREMKNSGIEWIGEFPSEWQIVKLKYLANILRGGSPRPIDAFLTDDPNGFNWIKIGDTIKGNKFINSTKQKIVSEGVKKSRVVHKGDLILTNSMSFGEPYILNIDGCIHDGWVSFSNIKNVSTNFLYYFLSSPFCLLQFKRQVDGGVVQNLNVEKIGSTIVLLPSFIQQERIADFLDKKCAEIDTVIEKTKATIEEYKKLKQSVITQAVTKGIRPNRPMKDSGIKWIGEIPEEWEIRRIKTLFSLRDERNFLPLSQVNLISLYTDKGVMQHSDIENTTGNKASNADGYKKVYPNDIVVNIILCWMGAIGRSAYKGVTSPAYDVYIPSEFVDSNFYHHYFRTTGFSGDCYKRGKGIMAMRWRTYSDQFRDINVVYPSLQEQREIVDYLDKKCSEIDELIAKKTSLLSELESYKKSLIYEYVTGKKEV